MGDMVEYDWTKDIDWIKDIPDGVEKMDAFLMRLEQSVDSFVNCPSGEPMQQALCQLQKEFDDTAWYRELFITMAAMAQHRQRTNAVSLSTETCPKLERGMHLADLLQGYRVSMGELRNGYCVTMGQ
jgi:hypothetical protein